jgi:hypothetical protein
MRSPGWSWLGLLGVVGAFACVPPLPLEGAPCPCPEPGYECRAGNVCVLRAGNADGSAGEDAPFVAPPADASIDGPASDGGATATHLVAAGVFTGDLGGVVLDESGLYLAESRTLGRILHVALGTGMVRILASDQPAPAGLAVDATHVYWTNSAEGSARPGAGAVMKVAKSGGAATTLAGSLLEPRGIAADDTHVFFATWADGAIRRVEKQGGSVQVIAADQKNPRTVALDGTHVYWGNFGAGDTTIRKAPRAGGASVLLADAAGSPVELVVDGERVYWLSYGTRAVYSVSKSGGAPVMLAPGAPGAGAAAGSHGLAHDADHVYWLDSFRISRVPRSGGAVTVVFEGGGLAGLASGTSTLYFGQGTDVLGLDKPPR